MDLQNLRHEDMMKIIKDNNRLKDELEKLQENTIIISMNDMKIENEKLQDKIKVLEKKEKLHYLKERYYLDIITDELDDIDRREKVENMEICESDNDTLGCVLEAIKYKILTWCLD